jgi:hypothetical integral membrane protein (TIGR02206 family)
VSVVAADHFERYGPSHLTVLAICLVGVVAMAMLGRRVRGTDAEVRVSRGLAVAIMLVTIPLQVLQLLPGEWDPQTSLPFQLCDLAWMFAVHALWTRCRVTATVTYLWGLTLTTQGMLTPDLESQFPEPRFLMFWGMHVLIVWAAIYLVLGLRVLPTWATYRRTVVITLAWAAAVMVYNGIAGTDYGYLNGKPESASALDLLPSWPAYVVVEIAIIAAAWALLTWPWVRQVNHLQTPAGDLP